MKLHSLEPIFKTITEDTYFFSKVSASGLVGGAFGRFAQDADALHKLYAHHLITKDVFHRGNVLLAKQVREALADIENDTGFIGIDREYMEFQVQQALTAEVPLWAASHQPLNTAAGQLFAVLYALLGDLRTLKRIRHNADRGGIRTSDGDADRP